MMNQKEATFQAVINVVGEINGPVTLSKEQRDKVVAHLVEGFQAGEIELSSAQADLKKYSVGLLNNWLRKDKRLNGGTQYITKNPGSRTGSSDPVIKTLRQLLTIEEDPEKRIAIQEEIDKRVADIKPAKKVTVDLDKIPAELREKLGL